MCVGLKVKEHEVIRRKRSLGWLEIGKIQMGRSTKEARLWSLPVHVKSLNLIPWKYQS